MLNCENRLSSLETIHYSRKVDTSNKRANKRCANFAPRATSKAESESSRRSLGRQRQRLSCVTLQQAFTRNILIIRKGTVSRLKTYKMSHIYYAASVLFALCAALLYPGLLVSAADPSPTMVLRRLKILDELPVLDVGGLATLRVEMQGIAVKPGEMVSSKHFKDFNIAKVYWDDNDEIHTLMLIDLDKRRKNVTGTSHNQYTNINIPGSKSMNGQAIVTYEAPRVPCQPSMKHRILLVLFRQDQNIDIRDAAYAAASPGHPEHREDFDMQEFAKRLRLTPIAANVFQASGDIGDACSGAASMHAVSNVVLFAMVLVTVLSWAQRNQFRMDARV